MAVPFDPLRLEVMGAAVPSSRASCNPEIRSRPNTAFLTMDHWFMLREVFRRTDVGWCGSVVTEQSNPWPLRRAPICSRGFRQTLDG